MESIQDILEFAERTAVEAGKEVLRHFGRVTTERKADRTVVTDADRASEALIVERVRERFPEHSVLGEEGTSEVRDLNGPIWVIDPIDGTSSFSMEMPIWGVSIGYFDRGRPTVGAFYMPILEECYLASVDGPALLNGDPIEVTAPGEIESESVLIVGSDFHRVARNSFPGKVRSYGSMAAHLCYVARGSATAAVGTKTHVWDAAAGALIVERAGGAFLTLDGRPVDWSKFLEERVCAEFLIACHPDVAPKIGEYLGPLE